MEGGDTGKEVLAAARSYARHRGGVNDPAVDESDRIQEAALAAIVRLNAADKPDGVKLATHASNAMRTALRAQEIADDRRCRAIAAASRVAQEAEAVSPELAELLDGLSGLERTIVSRWARSETLADIARSLSVKYDKVLRIHKAAIAKLRESANG